MKTLLLRIALAALAVSGGIVAVMLVRAATFRPDPVPRGDPFPFAFDELGAPERLAGALAIPTTSSSEPEESVLDVWASFHEHLRQSFPRVHQALEWETVAASSLLYRWPGTDAQLSPVLLAAHMDVVSADRGPTDAWRNGPFSGAVDGGYIWGRGAIDAKGSVLGILEAAEALVAEGFEPRRTIFLALTHDGESTEHDGARGVVRLLQERGTKPSWILGEGLYLMSDAIPGIRDPVGMIGVVEKAGMDLRLIARAEGGSLTVPPRRTAAGVLSTALARLEDQAFPPQMRGPVVELLQTVGPHMDPGTRMLVANLWLLERPLSSALTESPVLSAQLRTTVTPTSLALAPEAEPGSSEAAAELRVQIAPWESAESVVGRIESALSDLDVEVEVLRGGGAMQRLDSMQVSGSEGFDVLREAIHRSFPDVVAVVPAVTPTETDSSAFGSLSESVYGFAPFRGNEETLSTIHGPGERVRLGVYLDAIRFYSELIRRAAG